MRRKAIRFSPAAIISVAPSMRGGTRRAQPASGNAAAIPGEQAMSIR
jgi:hypothetical protein